MSAGVTDQRMKGQGNQVTNGPEEHVNEHKDFDSWRPTQHQGYTTTPISTTMPSDPYIPNYYGTSFPFQTYGVSDGTWSNSEPVTFLGSYGGQMGHDSYGMDGMFGGAFGQAAAPATGFNYFHGSGDYSTWGNSAAMSRKPHYDEYYRQENAIYPGGEALKGIEHGMQGLSLAEQKVETKEVKDMGQVSQPKKMTWATIASQPAKPQPQVSSSTIKKKGPGMPPPPMVPGKHNMDIGTWEGKNGSGLVKSVPAPQPPPPQNVRPNAWGGPIRQAAPMPPPAQAYLPAHPPQVPPQRHPVAALHPVTPLQTMPPPQPLAQMPPPQQIHQHQQHHQIQQAQQQQQQQQPQQQHHQHHPHPVSQPPQQLPQPAQSTVGLSHPVLEELKIKNNYNPVDFDLSARGARFFVIKSYSEDDIHRSIKYEIWCSTEHGNKRLDQAFRERESKGSVYLFFSVNGSGHFCGMARMTSAVDYNASSSVWSQDKWKGQFRVRWIYVKDVPNGQLRHIRLENNENKPVTNSRDTQEVPFDKGKIVLRIIHSYRHTTSIFDDFIHYERRQEEEDNKKDTGPLEVVNHPPTHKEHHQRGEGGGRGRGRGGRNH